MSLQWRNYRCIFSCLEFEMSLTVSIFNKTLKNYLVMRNFIKHLGVVVILLGVILLGIYAFLGLISNTVLVIAALLLLGGVAAHIILNKVFE
jgi:hypothetical protein